MSTTLMDCFEKLATLHSKQTRNFPGPNFSLWVKRTYLFDFKGLICPNIRPNGRLL